MTTPVRPDQRWLGTRKSFDALVARAEASTLSFDETVMLRDTHWNLGQDARLREDIRFRPTPHGRWMLAADFLANDRLYDRFHTDRRSTTPLAEALEECASLVGRRCVFCAADPRFVVDGEQVRLSARELSDDPVIDNEVGPLEKYTTHLPVHSLKATAASAPAGEWGGRAQDEVIETLGWLQVDLPGRKKLNERMFVARIEGHSMDNRRSGLTNGGYAVFELWPPGTRQNLNVLVRGAFRDPETGSYALKKYVADERDAEGLHHQITLVSLNPDKERFPDIELDTTDDDTVTVVAKVLQVLSPSDYARRPRAVVPRGRRDFQSEDGIRLVHERLAENAMNFFERASTAEPDKPDTRTWAARLVCLEAEAGGLHIEIGPLAGLWRFVKRLVVRDPSGDVAQTLASNARLRPVTARVAPSGGPWTWFADGFEDDPDVDLAALDLPPLPHDQAIVFKVDADSVGSLVSSRELSAAQRYRLLMHPDVWARAAVAVEAATLAGGWRLLEVDTDTAVLDRAVLEAFGLAVGEQQPSMSLAAATWPDQWRTNLRGERYACFAGGSGVVLQISGYGAEVAGEARLFVYGPGGVQSIDLPAGDTVAVQLAELEVGRYFCSILHFRSRVPPAHLPFEVVDALGPTEDAVVSVQQRGEQRRPLQPNSALAVFDGDLGRLNEESLEITGPHGWTVRVYWRELATDWVGCMYLDGEGRLDIARLLALTRDRRDRRALGDLVLGFDELGTAVLAHERRLEPEATNSELTTLLANRAEFVRQCAGAFVQLFPLWFEPVCTILGYEAEFLSENPDDAAPEHVALARLLVTERTHGGISRACRRVLVMATDMESQLSEGISAWVDRQCALHNVEFAVITTGLLWGVHRRRSRLPLKVWNLPEVLERSDDFIAFLRDTEAL